MTTADQWEHLRAALRALGRALLWQARAWRRR